VENKKKNIRTKRESFLKQKVYTQNYVLFFETNLNLNGNKKSFGTFFGLSAKFSNKAVIRNKIKRIFRELIRNSLIKRMPKELDLNKFSICLVSKKGKKFNGDISLLRQELIDGLDAVYTKINKISR